MTQSQPLPPVPGFTDLRSRIRAGDTLYGSFLQLGSPIAAELVARAGFDWVIIDLEHGAGTETELLASLLAVSTTPTAALVRPQSAERIRIGRALDHGAHGLMIPRIDRPEEAIEAISFMRFPPDGVRGPPVDRGAGLTERGRRRFGTSTSTGRDHPDQCRARSSTRRRGIDGVDVLFVGPADLRTAWDPGQLTTPIPAAVERTIAAADAHGKHRHPPARPPRWLATELGFRFIGIGADGRSSPTALGCARRRPA
jgi:2-dehydro-3-deoxyglucarate aldolase/4-hydroxy-2-oxoheptanedioate aldolase